MTISEPNPACEPTLHPDHHATSPRDEHVLETSSTHLNRTSRSAERRIATTTAADAARPRIDRVGATRRWRCTRQNDYDAPRATPRVGRRRRAMAPRPQTQQTIAD